jgi:3-phenylpropionate/trans-cinnamate dioxygenase ferredoxin reductase subunit
VSQCCVIVGASHAGVNLAFNLRRQGWEGEIVLYDRDPHLPYHRPPLSKEYLSKEEMSKDDLNPLKSAESYAQENIELQLGVKVLSLHRDTKTILLDNGTERKYNKLVIATGARPFVPPIEGLASNDSVFYLRTVTDVFKIRSALSQLTKPNVVIIGGGYIGLETAASLSKLGAKVTLIEREKRLLSRVTSPEMSTFFMDIHTTNGVSILTGQEVCSVQNMDGNALVTCKDGSTYPANMIIIGVGITVNTEIWEAAGIEIENGIKVNQACRTNDSNIYAIGDCTYHYSPKYSTYMRLESVQNAVDQAKVAAVAIVGQDVEYNAIPWFWSDQYDIKLQMVGISNGYDQIVIRKSPEVNNKFSVWYFKKKDLLAVDCVNDARSYMLGMKILKENKRIDLEILKNESIPLSPSTLFLD